jgi:hypothetical protein
VAPAAVCSKILTTIGPFTLSITRRVITCASTTVFSTVKPNGTGPTGCPRSTRRLDPSRTEADLRALSWLLRSPMSAA